MSIQATEQIVHPTVEELELGAVLHALSDPVRLQIVAELACREGEYTCGSFALPVTKSTCTHHFKVLREAGLIHQRPQGSRGPLPRAAGDDPHGRRGRGPHRGRGSRSGRQGRRRG
jgi:DNA-binding transcriptional ArsR family regulator